MADIEMDLYISQVEGRIMKQTIEKQQDMIANLKNHVAALQRIIEKQHSCIDQLLLLELGDDLDG